MDQPRDRTSSRSDSGTRSAAAWLKDPRVRAVGWVLAFACVLVGALVMLWPVLIAPLAADQRHMYAEAPGQTAGHWTRMFTIPIGDIRFRLNQGRFAPLAFIVQWVSYTGVTLMAMATSTSVATVQAAQKIVLLILSLGSVVGFAAALRGRTPAGTLVRFGRGALLLVAAAVTVLGAVGTQAQLQPANGWTTYAVLTYGAIIVGFGVPALALWLARRRTVAPSRLLTVLTVLVLGLVAAGLNSSYELYYVAVPVAVVTLALQPLAPAADRARERRAKLFVGGTLTALFLVALVAVRAAISYACASGPCYIGTSPKIDAGIVKTWLYNFGSSVPLSGRSEVLTTLKAVGQDTLPGPFSSPLVVFAFLAAGGLLLVRLLLGPLGLGRIVAPGTAGETADDAAVDTADETADETVDAPAARKALSVAALHGAIAALLIAFGSAAMMSISRQAQDVILSFGHVYRHTVVTWVALAATATFVALAIDLRATWRKSIVLWSAVALVAALVGGAVLPINLAATHAASVDPGTLAVTRIYDELVLADPSDAGEQRRCDAVRQARKGLAGKGPTSGRMLKGLYQIYRYKYGKPFCSSITIRGA
ncbi:hypothetical protein ACPPVT_17145 [Angustibacter sp. McL0619]|uniref:hypothetical protein n=1 Tax=Angustibacter sp. McL0619 TaxID=3415676 RepID=UPI003CF47DC1